MADPISIHVQVSGGPDLASAIANAFANMQPELLGVVTEEAEEIMAASKEIVPVDQGALIGSGRLYGTEVTADGVAVRFGYGGAASAYAKVQHETPPSIFSHAEGQSWKYLERPVFDAVTTMGPRLARRLAGRLSARFGGGTVSGGGGTFGGD